MTSASTMPLMPPRIVLDPYDRKYWMCLNETWITSAAHGRWTGLLLMAELSVGHTRYGEPRWERWENGQHVLSWPCRQCPAGAWTYLPARHNAWHRESEARLLSDQLRLARLQSYGPLRDA